MKALQFLTTPEPWPEVLPDDAPRLLRNLSTVPMALVDLDDPPLIADDWMVLKNRLTGICGSDSKQVLMDFEELCLVGSNAFGDETFEGQRKHAFDFR